MSDRRENLHKKFLDGIRVFNKYIFIRTSLMLAKSGKGLFSVVHHIGRRSGRFGGYTCRTSRKASRVISALQDGKVPSFARRIEEMISASCRTRSLKNISRGEAVKSIGILS